MALVLIGSLGSDNSRWALSSSTKICFSKSVAYHMQKLVLKSFIIETYTFGNDTKFNLNRVTTDPNFPIILCVKSFKVKSSWSYSYRFSDCGNFPSLVSMSQSTQNCEFLNHECFCILEIAGNHWRICQKLF